jgi:hypothetical protein
MSTQKRRLRRRIDIAEKFSARLEIQLSGAPSADDWSKKLDQVRALDFSAKNVKTQAARLFTGCGFSHLEQQDGVVVEGATFGGVSRLRETTRWEPEHIDDLLLSRLQTLQESVHALDKESAIQSATAFRADYEKMLAQAKRASADAVPKRSRDAAVMVKATEKLEAAMLEFLHQHRESANIPKKSEPGRYLADLFGEIYNIVGDDKERFQQVMRELSRGTPLRKRLPKPSPPHPDAVLRHLLDFSAKDGIDARLTFDRDRVPVLLLIPRDPIAALLLRAHQARTLCTKAWAKCAWCGEQFVLKRKDQRTCGKEKCRNNLKVKEYRDAQRMKR